MTKCTQLSLQRQCELVGVSRSGLYYEPVPESQENLALLRRLDQLHLERPTYGSRRLAALLRREGQPVNRKRVARLLEVTLRNPPWSSPTPGRRGSSQARPATRTITNAL